MPGPYPGLTPAMNAALAAANPMICGLLEVTLPGYDLRLVFGATEVQWGVKKFVGKDPTYGAWVSLDAVGDGIGDEVPALSVTLVPSTVTPAANLTAPSIQGSTVRIWFAVIDRTTGGVVPDPLEVFSGELDQPTFETGPKRLQLEYDIVSAFERLFLDDEGIRLSDAYHQLLWPGELGLQYMSGLVRTIIWGPGDRPPSALVTASAPVTRVAPVRRGLIE